jgi:hypothetical protein
MTDNKEPLFVPVLLRKAEELCKRRLEKDPANRALLGALAEVYRKQGDADQTEAVRKRGKLQEGEAYLGELFELPTLYPLGIGRSFSRFTFVPMTEQDYRNAAFHDALLLDRPSERIEMELEDLCRLQQQQGRGRSAHLIFHTAYCGSTLLSRYLGSSGHFFVCREPTALTQLSFRKYANFGDIDLSRWTRALGVTLALLTRTPQPGQVPVIKLHPACHNLFDELLSTMPDSRGLVLYSDLETFLVQTLKTPERRSWDRTKVRFELEEMREIDTAAMSDAQRCAYLWLAQIQTCRQALERYPTRLRSMNCQALFERPADTLETVAAFFDKPFSREVTDEIIARESRVHAKNREGFNADTRARLKKDLGRKHADEIKAGVEWVKEYQARTGKSLLPLPLPVGAGCVEKQPAPDVL